MGKIFQYSSAAYLLLIMLINMMGMQIAVLDYALNRDFIAANLCENRSAPQIRCEGKCYLDKQLAKTSETPDSTNHKSTNKVMDVDFFEPVRETFHSFRVDQKDSFNRLPPGKIARIFLPAVFRPPLFSC